MRLDRFRASGTGLHGFADTGIINASANANDHGSQLATLRMIVNLIGLRSAKMVRTPLSWLNFIEIAGRRLLKNPRSGRSIHTHVKSCLFRRSGDAGKLSACGHGCARLGCRNMVDDWLCVLDRSSSARGRRRDTGFNLGHCDSGSDLCRLSRRYHPPTRTPETNAGPL